MIRQYQNSPRMMQLMDNMREYLRQDVNADEFYNIVWNIDTAQGFGLDIWGRIVGVNRYINIPSAEQNLGFTTGAADTQTFNNGTFYAGEAVTNVFKLADDAYRVLILAKAMTNIVRASIPAINRVLEQLFPNRGACYVNDLGHMQMRFTFLFPLEPWEVSVLQTSGALPRPTGVRATIAQIPKPTFGFAEGGADYSPFNQGSFFSQQEIVNAS